jgi:hypothetical protein
MTSRMAWTTDRSRIVIHHLTKASMPEARQNNSKLAEMLARASNFRALVGMAVDVVDLFMALLSFVEQHPEPIGSRRATPLRLFQHPPGHRPRRN